MSCVVSLVSLRTLLASYSLFLLKRFLNKDCLQRWPAWVWKVRRVGKYVSRKVDVGRCHVPPHVSGQSLTSNGKLVDETPQREVTQGKLACVFAKTMCRAASLWSNLRVHTNCIEKHLIMPKSIKRDLPLAMSGWNNRYKIARTTSPLWKTLPKLDLSKC